MSDAPMPGMEREAIGRWSSDSVAEAYPVPDYLLQGIVDRVVRDTQATGAAIAVGTRQEMICRAIAGEHFSEVGSRVNTVSGLTGLCTSSEMPQYCMNTLLDDRVDAETCRELGIGAIVVVPLLHQERLIGLIGMYSSRPYAFGTRDFNALEASREEFSASLRSRSQAAAEAAKQLLLFDTPNRKNRLIAGIRKLGRSILRSVRIFRVSPASSRLQ
jgi:GAF domain-containing protein